MSVKNGFLKQASSVVLGLALVSCGSGSGSGSGGSDGESGADALMTKLESVSSSISDATPSTSSLTFALRGSKAITDFTNADANLSRIGDGSSSNISPAQYVGDILNPEYEVEAFTPTPYGRFKGDLEILEILTDQVPFSNGYPEIGDHEVTTEIYGGDDDEPMEATFTVTVTESASDNFDVVISINDSDIELIWSAALKVSETEIAMATMEQQSSTRGGFSNAYLNRQTGALKYEFIAKQDSGPTIELSRLTKDADGKVNLVSIYKESNNAHLVSLVAPDGKDSSEVTISFEKTGTNAISESTYCVSTTTFAATTESACSGAALPSGDLNDLVTEIDAETNASSLRASYFGADTLASVDNAEFSYSTVSDSEFHTTVIAD